MRYTPLTTTHSHAHTQIANHDCVSDALTDFVESCHVMDEHHIRYSRVIAHLCNDGYSAAQIRQVMASSPACRAY